jgi:hypothetical protein
MNGTTHSTRAKASGTLMRAPLAVARLLCSSDLTNVSDQTAWNDKTDKVDGLMYSWFTRVARLPTLEICTENKKFTADLNDANALFFNDSAEMPH